MDISNILKTHIDQWLFRNALSRKNRLFITTLFLKFLKKSDIKRWSKYENLYENWEDRTALMAQWIPTKTSILEFGCGRMALRKYLPDGCRYTPSDIVQRSEEVLVIDLNQSSPLYLPKHDVFVLSGVLEYVHDVDRFIKVSYQVCNLLIASYSSCERKTISTLGDRRSEGWVNDYSKAEFLELFHNNGFELMEEKKWKNQQLFCFQRTDLTLSVKSRSK
jgi:hypothetical protein